MCHPFKRLMIAPINMNTQGDSLYWKGCGVLDTAMMCLLAQEGQCLNTAFAIDWLMGEATWCFQNDVNDTSPTVWQMAGLKVLVSWFWIYMELWIQFLVFGLFSNQTGACELRDSEELSNWNDTNGPAEKKELSSYSSQLYLSQRQLVGLISCESLRHSNVYSPFGLVFFSFFWFQRGLYYVHCWTSVFWLVLVYLGNLFQIRKFTYITYFIFPFSITLKN